MKKNLALVSLVLMASLNSFGQETQSRKVCGTHEDYLYMMKTDPVFRQNQEDLEKFTQDFTNLHNADFRTASTLVTIPVVVHVIYNSAAQNITDEQIKSQIDVLNEDFNNVNYDQNKIPPAYRSRTGNMQIRFEMARRDPSGNPTNGITRTSTAKTFFCTSPTNDAKFASTGGHDIWDRNSYLNLWVVPAIAPSTSCNASSTNVLGYAQFPGGAANTDGVVIDYSSFGRPAPGAPYNLGRTAAHEVGHWLNLRHIWGDDGNLDNTCTTSGPNECSLDDQVTDTPFACDAHNGNPGCFSKTCTLTPVDGEMWYNYMDYSNDASLFAFTQGQVTRSAALFSIAPVSRASLMTSNGLDNVAGSPADDAGIYDVISPTRTTLDNITTSFNTEVVLKNFGTATLTSCTISYYVDAQTPNTYNWTGSLASGATVNVALPNQLTVNSGTHYFYAYTTLPNGVADGNSVNDRIQRRFLQHTTTQALPYTQNFDALTFLPITSLWQNKNYDCSTGAWAKATNTYAGAGSAFFTNFTQTAPVNRMDEIITPFLNLNSQAAPKLGFWMAYAPQNTSSSDTLEILISTDGGYNYTSLYKKWGNALQTAAPTTSAYAPASLADWRYEIVDLTPYQSTKNALIAFRNITTNQNNIYLDEILVDELQSVQNVSGVSSFQVYPNPNNGQFTIRAGYDKNVGSTIFVTNTLGQTVFSKHVASSSLLNATIDLSELSAGIYNVVVKTELGILTQKISIR